MMGTIGSSTAVPTTSGVHHDHVHHRVPSHLTRDAACAPPCLHHATISGSTRIVPLSGCRRHAHLCSSSHSLRVLRLHLAHRLVHRVRGSHLGKRAPRLLLHRKLHHLTVRWGLSVRLHPHLLERLQR
jgi:hypothetical protein